MRPATPQVDIAGRPVGADHPPFVIAEAGINHNGQLELALRMVQVAKASGADAIKFQTFTAEGLVGDPKVTYTYQSQGKQVTESMQEMFRRVEFCPDEWRAIKHRCDETGILFLSTPQNVADLDLLLSLGVGAIKVGSDDFATLPLLKRFASTGLPLLTSCGMADLGEVYQALSAIGSLDGYPTVLLLCTSEYPTPPEDVHLLKLRTLAQAFPMVVLGFSDHTRGMLASSLAVALGARVFEKHFTLDHGLPGPDHWFSEDPASLKEWVDAIHSAYRMMGSAIVRPTTSEAEMRKLARRSVVALRDIGQGEILSLDNLGLRRPGTGLPPSYLERLLGRKTTRPVAKGNVLELGDCT